MKVPEIRSQPVLRFHQGKYKGFYYGFLIRGYRGMQTREKWWESEDLGEEPIKRINVSVEDHPFEWTLGFSIVAGVIAWLVMQFAE